uniref:Uncharacterized protein n=1 Tax=Anguilla anguilla TaxID=7936 RepID=A0A0E9WAF4_ANGAN
MRAFKSAVTLLGQEVAVLSHVGVLQRSECCVCNENSQCGTKALRVVRLHLHQLSDYMS